MIWILNDIDIIISSKNEDIPTGDTTGNMLLFDRKLVAEYKPKNVD